MTHLAKVNLLASRLNRFITDERLRVPGAMFAGFESMAFEFGGHELPQ